MGKPVKKTPLKWQGIVAIKPGLAAFRGRAGDNKEHSHWPHQISIAMHGGIDAWLNGLEISTQAIYIPSGTAHRLGGIDILSIYIDPAHRIAQSLLTPSALTTLEPGELPQAIAQRVDICREASSDPDAFVEAFSQIENVREIDRRLQIVIDQLWKENEVELGRAELSDLVGLSPTRFSHWFKEQTGVPLRSYRKWLRLSKAVQFALSKEPLVTAATKAGFTDQAHFSRTFSATFGVTVSEIVAAMT